MINLRRLVMSLLCRCREGMLAKRYVSLPKRCLVEKSIVIPRWSDHARWKKDEYEMPLMVCRIE